MKDLKFVLVSLAILSMGMASCVTTSKPKLDLSAVDPAQPIPVIGILMRTPSGAYQDQFFQKYGYGDPEEWNNDPQKLEQLHKLDVLGSTESTAKITSF
jgi:hypothetical protein